MAELNAASPRPCPFSTLEFLTTHTQHNGIAPGAAQARALILTAHRGSQLIGYLPLRRVVDRVLGQRREKIECLVMNDIDRPHLVARAEDLAACAEAFYRALLERERDWTFLELGQQDAASPLYPVPPSVDTRGIYIRRFENASNATIDVPYASLVEYVAALPKKMRGNLKRYGRRLFGAGEVTLVSTSDFDALPHWLDLYCSVEARSWKHGIDGVVGNTPERVRYFRGLMDPAQPMRLTIHLLALDGCPVAGIINGQFLDGLHALQVAYDEDYRELDPGSMMFLASMRQAITQRCRSYNLLSGYSYYKEQWLARITPSRSIQLYRTPSIHYLKARGGELKRLLGSFLAPTAQARSNPARERAVSGGVTASRARREEERAWARRHLDQAMGTGLPVDKVEHGELRGVLPFAAAT